MPELPDVEVYRRRLEHAGLRRRIAHVEVPDPTVLRGVSGARLADALRGRELVGTGRRGKHLFALTSDRATLVMHFGMTGVLEVDGGTERRRYERLTLQFGDGGGLLLGYRGGVKALLMDQSLVAGIGNIYSDEILFQARIDPRHRADSLDDAAVRRLHRQMLRVLRVAADRGADPSRVPRGWLLRHREGHAQCPRGNGEIRKIRLGGRGGYYCPACQQ